MSSDGRKREEALACLRQVEIAAGLASKLLFKAAEEVARAELLLAEERAASAGVIGVQVYNKSGQQVYHGPLGMLLLQCSEMAGLAARSSDNAASNLERDTMEVRLVGEEALTEAADGQLH